MIEVFKWVKGINKGNIDQVLEFGVWVGMTGGMAECWIVPRVGDKELPRVTH